MQYDPGIDLQLKLIENDQVVQQLTDNSIDIAFTIGNPIDYPSITSLLKKREEIQVLSAPTHPLVSKHMLERKDFTNQLYALPYKNDYEVYIQLFCHNFKWLSSHLAEFIELIKRSA